MKNIALLFALFLPLVACSQQKVVENVNVEQLSKVDHQADNNIVVLDVRTDQEVNEAHIEGSQHIDVLRTDEFTTKVNALDKEKTYYVICRSGGRSSKAANMMIELGFKNVYNVEGGMTAWQAKGYAVE